MKIPSLPNQITHTGLQDPLREAVQGERPSRKEVVSVHGDRVDINLSQDLTEFSGIHAPAQTDASSLSPERLSELRSRVQNGYYASEQIVGQTAASLLEFHSLPV